MGDYSVISIVDEVLQKLLQKNLAATFSGNFTSEASVTLISPKDLEATSTNTLSLFLYQVTENAYIKNQPVERIDGGRLRQPPLALNLYYLLTPYMGEDDNRIRGWDIHTILGRAMQVLYDNAILQGPSLMDILKDIGRDDYYEQIEQIKIVLHQLSLDDITKIWSCLDTPMRLSVCYEVRIIMIDSERSRESRRIIEKDAHYYQIK